MFLSRFYQGNFGMFQESRPDTDESLLTDVKKKERWGPSPHCHWVKRGTAINAWTPTEMDFLTTQTPFPSADYGVSWWKQPGLFKIYGTMSFCVTTDQQYAYSCSMNTRWDRNAPSTDGSNASFILKRPSRSGGNTPFSCNVSQDDVFRNDVSVIV